MNLYDLTGNFLTVSKMIEEGECDNQALLDTLESIECALEVKVENTAYVIETAKANRKVLADTIERFQAKLKTLDNNIESTEKFLFGQLDLMGITNIKAGLFTIKQQKNPPSVEIINPDLVPAKYQTVIPQSYSINKKDIVKDLKAGVEVAGCKLRQGSHWTIK